MYISTYAPQERGEVWTGRLWRGAWGWWLWPLGWSWQALATSLLSSSSEVAQLSSTPPYYPFWPPSSPHTPPPPPQPQTPKLPSHSLSCTMYPTELSSSLLCFFFQLVFTLNFSLSHLMSLRPVSFVLACIHSACNWTLSTCIAYPERMRHMQGCAEGCRAQPLSW